MIIDIKAFFCNFIGGFALVLALFMAIAPWNWMHLLFGTLNINHGLCTGVALLLFLLMIVAFRRFNLYDIFLSSGV